MGRDFEVGEAGLGELGEGCLAVHADVISGADIQAMLATATSTFGRLDIVCNNAGIDGELVPTGECSEENYDRVMGINARGVFLGMRYAIPILVAGGGGAIVNTASIAGLVGLATSGHYVAAKHGVVGLTKTAAIEYAQDGIRVNCVNPGYVTTPMTKEVVETRLDATLAKVPMNRMGVPEEIAEAVVWMCSDKASFMTGACQVVDGGYYAA